MSIAQSFVRWKGVTSDVKLGLSLVERRPERWHWPRRFEFERRLPNIGLEISVAIDVSSSQYKLWLV